MSATVSLATQLVTVAVLSLQRQLYHNRGLNRNSWNNSYDFIVVGSGTAGSIVAGRLSENPNVTVLLLEAGGPMTITNDMVPTYYFFQPAWGYFTVPQRNAAFGLNNRQAPEPRGKLLGGTHAINFAAYTRGNQHDYNHWENYYGATGWNYANVLPFFLRSENNTDPAVVAANPQVHSTRGPIEISTLPHPDPFIERWLHALNQLGWPLSDFSDPVHQYGASMLQATQSPLNWTRQTTASGFIEVNIARPNLHVLINAHVTRVLISPQAGTGIPTATGVEFVRNNQTYQVMANHEVILSAGPINTPQILMLSGIGPRQHLTQLGIPVTLDLPVGDNLHDHFLIQMDFTVNNASDIDWSGNLYYNLNVQNLYDYFARSTGPLSRLPLPEAYYATGINGDMNWPDGVNYLLFNQVSPTVDAALPLFDQSRSNEWRQYLSQFVNNNRHVSFAFSMFRPLSTGTLRLASANPYDAPLIDPAFFSNTQDLIATVRAMSIGINVTESSYLAPYMSYSQLPMPGCQFCPNKPLSQCYSYLACAAQTYTLSSFHPVGTCKMGNTSSTDAVVSERLRVLGTRHLRVIDSSIMPRIPNANPNAATMMIGERGAQMVQDDWVQIGLNMG